MLIVINQQNITINKFSDLIEIIVTLPQEQAKELIQQFIANPDFKLIIKDRFDLKYCVKALPEVYAQEMIATLFVHLKEFKRLISNYYQLQSFVKDFPNYTQAIMDRVLTIPEEFKRIIDNVYILPYIVDDLPGYVQVIIDKVLSAPGEFSRLIPNHFSLIGLVKKDLPEIHSKKILEHFRLLYQEIPLNQAVASNDLDDIKLLLNLGEDPNIEDEGGRNALCVLRDRPKYSEQIAMMLILYGADPDKKYSNKGTLLHDLARQNSFYIPELLSYGANPTIKDGEEKNPLDIILAKQPFTEEDEKHAILLLQYGAVSHALNLKNENILDILYRTYPDIKKFIISKGLSKNKLNDTNYIFKHIDMFSLRLEIKLQSPLHQTRNTFLNLCLQLALGMKEAGLMQTLLNALPPELVLHIVSFMELEKTPKECAALINASIDQCEAIKKMFDSPGGISVLQQHNKDGSFTISFFNSAPSLCVTFDELKKKIIKRIQDRPVWNKSIKKELSVAELNQFRNKFADNHLNHQLSFYKRAPVKAALQRSVQDSELYQPENRTNSF